MIKGADKKRKSNELFIPVNLTTSSTATNKKKL